MIGLGNNMTLPEFERLLDVYGSDRTRWPVEARASAAQLAARDPAACRLLVEAEALDRVLERAPLPSLASEAALAERIVAAAQRSPRMVRTGDGSAAVAGPAKASAAGTSGGSVLSFSERRRWLHGNPAGRAAGLLAACLMLGIFLGASALPQPLIPALEELTGLSLASGNAMQTLDPFDEDLL